MALLDILGRILGGGNAPSPFAEDPITPITPRMPQQEQTFSPNMMQSGNQFNVNPSLFSGLGQQASQAAQGVGGQKPLGFLAPYANKIPGMQGLGNMMSADNYQLPKILNAVAGPMMFSNKGGRRTQMYQQSLGDLLAGKSLGGGQQGGQPQAAQPVAQQPAPQPTAKPSMLPAAEVAPQTAPQPTGKNFAPLMGGGQSPGQTSSSQDITMFQPQRPNFSNSQQVSGGTVGSPDMATPPSVEQSPMAMPREITSAVTDAARYTRPTIDPWIAGMMTGIRPGSNPHTGHTAGGDYTRMALAEGDLAAKRGTDLMKAYAATMEAGNKPLLQYWQGMEHQAKYKQIMGDDQIQQAAAKLKYAESLAEGIGKKDAEQSAIADLYNNPVLRNMATPPELQKLGIMHMGQVAAMAKTGDARVLSEVVRNVGQMAQAQIAAASRIQAAGISAGAHTAATQNQTAALTNQVLHNYSADVDRRRKAIEALYFDPEAVKLSTNPGLKEAMQKNKTAMTPDIKAEYDALRGTQNLIGQQFGNLAQTIGSKVASPSPDQYKPGAQPTAPQRKPEAIGDTPQPKSQRRVPAVNAAERVAVKGEDGKTYYQDPKDNKVYADQTGGTALGVGSPLPKSRRR